jgi:hypothetical protein
VLDKRHQQNRTSLIISNEDSNILWALKLKHMYSPSNNITTKKIRTNLYSIPALSLRKTIPWPITSTFKVTDTKIIRIRILATHLWRFQLVLLSYS